MYVIDVSQIVKTDHPLALDFCRRDASNVNDFWNMSMEMPSDGNSQRRQPEFADDIVADKLVDADGRSQYFTDVVSGKELIVVAISKLVVAVNYE